MQTPSWNELFKRIPVPLHDSLTVSLSTGEIMLQAILRLEDDFILVRGRMSGCTEAPRVLVIPYQQIIHVAFIKPMLEDEVKDVFGDLLESPTGLKKRASEEASRTTAGELDAPEQKAAQQLKPAASTEPAKTPPSAPSKSMLLARLRARLAEHAK